jgi:hypothetical protein
MSEMQQVILGSAGVTPGLHTLDAESGKAECVLAVPHGDSIASVASTSDGRFIAAGTRAGRAYVGRMQDGAPGRAWHRLGAAGVAATYPVLDVCFVSGGRLAVADIMGCCRIFDSESSSECLILGPTRSPLCSVTQAGDDLLAGLTGDGEIILWDLDDGRQIKAARGPRPPVPWVFARLEYWPSTNSLVYPADDGQVVLYSLADGRVSCVQAHQQGFYVVSCFGDAVVTIGTLDGRARVWTSGCASCTTEFRCRPGVTAAMILGERPLQLTVVCANGDAELLEADGGVLASSVRASGQAYTTVDRLGADARNELRRREGMRDAAVLAERASALMHDTDGAGGGQVDTLHRELSEQGYEHVSLALRAEEARLAGDMQKEIECRRKLAAILPAGAPETCEFWACYGDALRRAWCPEEASDAFGRALALKPKHQCRAALEELGPHVRALQGGNWLVWPDAPLNVLVACADALGKAFTGNWVAKAYEEQFCPRVHVTADEIREKYEWIRAVEQPSLPSASLLQLWLVSGPAPTQELAVLIPCAGVDLRSVPALVVLPRREDAGTLVRRVLICALGSNPGMGTISDHNTRVRQDLSRIESNGSVERSASVIQEAVRRALAYAANSRTPAVSEVVP